MDCLTGVFFPNILIWGFLHAQFVAQTVVKSCASKRWIQLNG